MTRSRIGTAYEDIKAGDSVTAGLAHAVVVRSGSSCPKCDEDRWIDEYVRETAISPEST